ncbi:MAG TPA: hypothetical protein VHE99_05750 [Gammaproteobacteria bacterium]|nr:hypothetical protein [Gammaproteobacteria bacterium]
MKKIFLLLFFGCFVLGAYAESEIGMVVHSNDMRVESLLTCNGRYDVWSSADVKSGRYFSYELINQRLNGATTTHCFVSILGPSELGTLITESGGTVDVNLDQEHRTVSFSNPQFHLVKGIFWRNNDNALKPTIGHFDLTFPAVGVSLISYVDDTAVLDGQG